jgi:hypothetical protein
MTERKGRDCEYCGSHFSSGESYRSHKSKYHRDQARANPVPKPIEQSLRTRVAEQSEELARATAQLQEKDTKIQELETQKPEFDAKIAEFDQRIKEAATKEDLLKIKEEQDTYFKQLMQSLPQSSAPQPISVQLLAPEAPKFPFFPLIPPTPKTILNLKKEDFPIDLDKYAEGKAVLPRPSDVATLLKPSTGARAFRKFLGLE